ncbi:hypothetical protein [Actinomadura sp. CNU-125]|uniref:hypothetical protein n=1 Tax=Actinomadura sp. CNU-125 TaxID=1904961 RepID=UPI0021CC7584|nr:hypothetical protein [Actinomadura sp. CNU-125]
MKAVCLTPALLVLIMIVAAAPTPSDHLAMQQRIIIELASVALGYVIHAIVRPPEQNE